MPPNVFTGAFEDDVLIMVNRGARGFTKTIWDFSGNDASSFTMQVSPDGNQWSPMMEGHYKKTPA